MSTGYLKHGVDLERNITPPKLLPADKAFVGGECIQPGTVYLVRAPGTAMVNSK
jgi:hypothetical protein